MSAQCRTTIRKRGGRSPHPSFLRPNCAGSTAGCERGFDDSDRCPAGVLRTAPAFASGDLEAVRREAIDTPASGTAGAEESGIEGSVCWATTVVCKGGRQLEPGTEPGRNAPRNVCVAMIGKRNDRNTGPAHGIRQPLPAYPLSTLGAIPHGAPPCPSYLSSNRNA